MTKVSKTIRQMTMCPLMTSVLVRIVTQVFLAYRQKLQLDS